MTNPVKAQNDHQTRSRDPFDPGSFLATTSSTSSLRRSRYRCSAHMPDNRANKTSESGLGRVHPYFIFLAAAREIGRGTACPSSGREERGAGSRSTDFSLSRPRWPGIPGARSAATSGGLLVRSTGSPLSRSARFGRAPHAARRKEMLRCSNGVTACNLRVEERAK